MKILNLLPIIMISTLSFAQVRVNTTNIQGILHIDGAKDNPTNGTLTPLQQANDFTVIANGNTGIGTILPTAKLDVAGTTTAPPIKASNMETSYQATNADSSTLVPISIDKNGVMVKQYSPIITADSYSLDGVFTAPTGTSVIFLQI